MPRPTSGLTATFAFLYPSDEVLSEKERAQIQVHRLLSLLGGVLVVLFGFLYGTVVPGAVDPWAARIGIAGLLWGLVGASCTSSYVRRHIVGWVWGLFGLTMVWFTVLTVLNGFVGSYAIGLLLTFAILLAGVGLGAQTITPVLWFGGLGLALVGIGAALGPPAQTSLPLLFTSMVAVGLGETIIIERLLAVRTRLREQESRLRSIANNLSDGIYRSTPDEGLIYANQALVDLFGYDSFEELARGAPERLYANPEVRDELIRSEADTGSIEVAEVEYQRKDGSTFIGRLRSTQVVGADGTVQYHDGVITDITEQKARERRLRVLSRVAEQAGDGILVTEARSGDGNDTPIVYANQAFEDMTGYEEDELLGKTSAVLRGPDTDPDVIASLRKAQAREEAWEGETVNYRKDGTAYVAQWNVAPIRDEAGEIEYWVSVQRDVTEQRELEASLQEREARLRGLANSIPGVVYQFYARPDGTYGYHFVGKHTEDILGIPADPSTFYERFMARVPDPHETRVREAIDEAVAEADSVRIETPFDRPDGERIWLLCTSTPKQRPEEIVFNGVMLDITRRREGEERWRALVESHPGGVVISVDGEYRYVNPAAADIIGVDGPEALIGTPIADQLPADERARAAERKEKIEAGEATDPWEHEILGVDGSRRTVVAQSVPITYDGEQAAQTVLRDVTERKQMEEALRRREERLRAITENVSEGIYRSTPDEGLVYANQAFAEMFGYDAVDDVLALDPEALYARPEERKRLRRQARQNDSFGALEVEFRRRDGSTFTGLLSGTTVRAADGTVDHFDGAIADITDRKEYERALRDERDRLALLLENLPVPVVHGVPTGDAFAVLSVNAAFEDTFGVDAETIEGDDLHDYIVPEDARAESVEINRRVVEGENPEAEVVRRAAEGPRSFRVRAAVRRPDENDDPEVYAIYSDITEQKRREEALRKAKEEAEEASRMKSAFLANMSHEIRTPLTSIIGFAEAMGDEVSRLHDGASAEENLSTLARFAGLIEDSGNRLLETLDGILNLSKLEAGEMGLSPEPVDLGAEARKTVEQLAPQAEEEGVRLDAEVGGGAPVQAWADAQGVQIVLRNLVSNAIKYTDDGGEAWVRARREESDLDGRRAVLEVEDTGIGMDPALAETIFKPFRQASEGTTREYEGTGLGLAVTRRAVDQMNGTIEVETEEGVGSRFTVRLPAEAEGDA